jgi:TonB family protein
MPISSPQDKEKRKPDEGKPAPGYRGGIFDQIDVPVLTSFTGCLLLFILLLVGIRKIDYSVLEKPSLEQISDRVAKIIMPLKPPGKPAPKPQIAPIAGIGKPRGPAGAGQGDATALARIERSRATVTRQITQVQERITKAAVLSILSGKGPGTEGKTVGRPGGGKGGDRFAGFGDLDARFGSIEGLTKYDGKKGSVNREGASPRETKEAEAQTSGIADMVKGFAAAKSNLGSKMGVANLEPPTPTDRSAKFTGNRSPSDVAAFVARKQATVSLLYEERLKSNPGLEGKVTVILVIEEDGTVSSASVLRSETSLDDPDFTEELLRRIKRWIFPPSSGGPVEMKSPFVFRPS